MSVVNPKYSDYYRLLDESAKLRYNQKLNGIGLQVDDPYTITSRESFTETDTVPNIEYPDMYSFFYYKLSKPLCQRRA